MEQTSRGCLTGIRVLDLSEGVAGPYCTKLLAELGAEVIKVERPGTGDPSRMALLDTADVPEHERSALFLYLNTGKKSVVLDLHESHDLHIIEKLIVTSDILVESYMPGTLAALGLDEKRINILNEHLIVTSITCFGQTGPYREFKYDEITALAAGGLLFMTGDPDRPPLKVGGAIAQYCAGMNAFVGTLLALLARRESGQGQCVDISIMETVMNILEGALTQWSFTQDLRYRSGTSAGAAWGCYPCKDGFVAVVWGTRDNFRKLAELCECPQLADPRYDSQVGRQQYKDEIDALLINWLLQHTREEIYRRAQALRLPFGYFCTLSEVLTSPHLRARDFFVALEHPCAGALLYPGAPYRMTQASITLMRAPLLGEHTYEILHHLVGAL